MLAQREEIARRAARDEGADGDSAADALGDDDRVGQVVGVGELVLEGEPVAGAARAGLDLVDDQQGAVRAGETAGLGQEPGRQGHDARLALDRLEHDRGNIGAESRGERVEVGGQVLHTGHHRLERRAQGRFAGEGERPHRATVEALLEGQDARAARAARELERGLDRLGAGVGRIDPAGLPHPGQPHQALGERDRLRRREVVAHVHEPLRLRADRLDDRGMRVTESVDGDAGEEVEVLAPVDIPHAGTAPVGERRHRARGRALGDPGEALAEGIRLGTGDGRTAVRGAAHGTTSVPMPSCVKISSRIECGTRPSMIAALPTPPSTASRQAVIFGIMPDSSVGSIPRSSSAVIADTRES